MTKSGSALLFFLVKAAITISLIVVIFMKIDFSVLARHLDGGGAVYLFFGTLLLAINVLVVAARWWLLLRRLGVEALSLGYAMAGTYASVFVGQATPGAIGADAVRGWLCYGRGVALRTIIMSLVTDRLLALLGLVGVSLAVWYWQFDAAGRSMGVQIAILAAALAAGAAFALWLMPALTDRLAKRWVRLRKVHELVAIFRFTALSRAGAAGLLLSGIVVALTVNAVILFAHGFGVALAPSVAYLVVPIAILFSSLPISIGGWGVREASLSYGLVLFGLRPDDAALLGLALGIGLLLASLPGGIVMLMLGGQARPALHRAGGGLID
ncbi:MAG: lysylphosphatidylglycerol synthase transmembrane domain-containing protein [Xanthobacteraceae bacterium]